MTTVKIFKCICSLMTMSKCLYFIKKMICFAVITLIAASVVMCIRDKGKGKNLIRQFKAVI